MTRGGPRPGAGRPRSDKSPTVVDISVADPVDFLLALMRDPGTDIKIRILAATAAAPYLRRKLGETGRKGDARDRAAAAATGRFAPGRPPAIVRLGGKDEHE